MAANRRRYFNYLQWLYFTAVLIFVGIAIIRDLDVLMESLSQFSSPKVFASTLFVVIGLAISGVVWFLALRQISSEVNFSSSQEVFFVGQLGKYLPGSVWAIVAQAKMADKLRTSPKNVAATSILCLVLNLVTATLLGIFAVDFFSNPVWNPLNRFVWLCVLCLLTIFFLRKYFSSISSKLVSLKDFRLGFNSKVLYVIITSVLSMWICYGISIALLIYSLTDDIKVDLIYLTASFAAAYALGMVAVFAPAGLGIREFALVFALSKSMDVTLATSVAVTTRLLHLVADFGLAFLWLLLKKYASK